MHQLMVLHAGMPAESLLAGGALVARSLLVFLYCFWPTIVPLLCSGMLPVRELRRHARFTLFCSALRWQ